MTWLPVAAPMAETEADTCRKFVVPMLRKAGWDDAPHAINEQRTFTDGRIVFVGGKARRGRQKRVDYILRYRSHFPIAVVEAKARCKHAFQRVDQEPSRARRRIADQLAFPQVEQTDHEAYDGTRGEELAQFPPERASKEPLESKPLMSSPVFDRPNRSNSPMIRRMVSSEISRRSVSVNRSSASGFGS